MWGIGGIINANLHRDEPERRLLAMQNGLRYRGPDDEELSHADYVLCDWVTGVPPSRVGGTLLRWQCFCLRFISRRLWACCLLRR